MDERGEGHKQESLDEGEPPGGEVIPVPFGQDGDEASAEAVADDEHPRPGELTAPATPVQEFFIPVHNFVRLTEREVEIVDHPAFQRLGEILQLGQTHLVYRGATHRRHEHALGTLHVAHLIMEALHRNVETHREHDGDGGKWVIDELKPVEVEFVRLGALLHDIGHLPAGHTFEDELGLFAKHDSLERLDLVLERAEWDGVGGKSLDALVNELYAPVAEEGGISVEPAELLRALVASDYEGVRGAQAYGGDVGFRLRVCRDLIGNTICADLLDYLHRDLHHLGKHKQFDTRLIDYMEVRCRADPPESKLVVNLRDGDKLRHDAVSGVLDLLESRYQLFEVALFHRTKLASAAMLERAVSELADVVNDKGWLRGLPETVLEMSDSEMLTQLRRDAEDRAKRARGDNRAILKATGELFVALRQRRLHAKLYQRFQDRFRPSEAERVRGMYGHIADAAPNTQGEQWRNRLRALRNLESDFQLPPLSLGMYCPQRNMSTKVAEVNVLRGDEVDSLAKLEEKEESPLTGGHLEAQRLRFRRLWHVYFSCDRGVLQELRERKLYPLLIQAIDCFVLKLDSDPVSLEDRALTIARGLAQVQDSLLYGREVFDEIPAAMRSGDRETYPSGLPVLRSLCREG